MLKIVSSYTRYVFIVALLGLALPLALWSLRLGVHGLRPVFHGWLWAVLVGLAGHGMNLKSMQCSDKLFMLWSLGGSVLRMLFLLGVVYTVFHVGTTPIMPFFTAMMFSYLLMLTMEVLFFHFRAMKKEPVA